MTQKPNLFSPLQVGALSLPNRIVMAPMTRNRAEEGNAPTAMNATYYTQRASAGLIITEATQVSWQGVGYPNTPGIHTDKQVAGWRLVTNAVHAKGGRIFLQLWHVGRVSHPSMQPDGALPVAPSAIAPSGEIFTASGPQPFVTPRALEQDEIPGIVQQFADSARRAKEAGFDGIELHAANGYLVEQFLFDGSNKRTDAYGGSLENRTRFLLEVTQALCDVWGGNRVGVRLSPQNVFNSMSDSDRTQTSRYAVEALNRFGLAYLHVVEMLPGHSFLPPDSPSGPRLTPFLRSVFHGPLMVNGGYTQELGDKVIASGAADLVSFGVPFLANPDLPKRFAQGATLNTPDRATFYSGSEKGYIDYPFLT